MKDDKKKIMVLGILAVVILAVGAFSFLGGSPPPPAAVAKKEEGKDGAKVDAQGNPIADPAVEDPAKNPLYVEALPQRDPFQIGVIAGDPTKPTPPITPPPVAPTLPKANSGRRSGGRRSGGNFDSGYQPAPIGGNLPTGPLPGGPLTITPSGPDPSAFGYQVSGVIVGQRSAAVFTDAGGNQRLIPVGGSLDGDSKVISIDKNQVTVEHRGKKLRLPLGGNPK